MEAADQSGALRHVIVGVGVNVNVDDEALRAALRHEAREAASLREAGGREIDRNLFAAAFLNHLEHVARGGGGPGLGGAPDGLARARRAPRPSRGDPGRRPGVAGPRPGRRRRVLSGRNRRRRAPASHQREVRLLD